MSMKRSVAWLVAAGITSVALGTGAPARAGGWRGGFERLSETAVPLDGREVVLPFPRRASPQDIRVVLKGRFNCSYNGRSYDAVGAADASGAFEWRPSDTGAAARQHHYVQWRPADLKVGEYAPSTNECVLHFPRHVRETPGTVSVWVDVDRFVTDFIIAPSEVRRSLSGDLRMEVWRKRRSSPAGPVAAVALASLVALAVVIVRRRRHPLVEMSDVQELLRRIDGKHESAVATIRDRREDSFELTSELERLRNGARELARHIEAFRGAARTVDRAQLDREIGAIEQRLQETDRADVREEIEATLAAKRKLRDLLADSDASEARYLLRLSKIESTIDATTMRVTSQEQRLADEVREDQSIVELEAELKSLDEAIEELSVVD